jgi:ABC-2 type transport system permease protein
MKRPNQKAAEQVAALQEGGLRRTLHDIGVVTQRNLLLDLRNPAVIVGATAFPVSLMVIFTASFAQVVMPGARYADYAQFLVPLSVVQGLLFSCISIGTALFYDLRNGMDARLRALPIARSTALAARILSGAGRLLTQVIIITLVGHLLGFRFQVGIGGAIAFLLLPVVFTSAFAWVAVFFAVRANAPESIQVSMTPWLLPLTFLSIGYVPKESFPDWLQGFVAVNPVSSVAQALRGLSAGGDIWNHVLATLLWSLGITGIFGVLAVRAYRQR